MRVAFRTDASTPIGTGHFMRCLTLACELKRKGAQIRFISRNLPIHLREMLYEKGVEHVPLSSKLELSAIDELLHAKWLGTSQAQDAQATIEAMSDQFWDWIIVDHYALDARWEREVRVSVKYLMVIDDLADRQHDCDLLLDQNFYSNMQSRYVAKVPKHCQLLLGPRFALLREEFSQLHEKAKTHSGEVKKILIFFGGIDANNYTNSAMEALANMTAGIRVDVVIGAQNPNRSQIQNSCKTYGFICHIQITHMAELMVEADLAICAGGTAMWERCCLGLPTLSLCIAENQRQQILDAAEIGRLYAPAMGGDLVELIHDHTTALLENQSLLKLISKLARNEVDGKGANRTVSAMGFQTIKVRLANHHDLHDLFQLRNHSTIREVSINKEVIPWEEHERWFARVANANNSVLLIGEEGNQPVGVVRFDKSGKVAQLSIYIVPDSGFWGQGHNLLHLAEQWLKAHHPDISIVRANVLGENLKSINLFIRSSYQRHSTCFEKQL